MDFLSVLTLIFITLKLLAVIDWSWWAVLSPLIAQAVLIFGLLAMAAIAALR